MKEEEKASGKHAREKNNKKNCGHSVIGAFSMSGLKTRIQFLQKFYKSIRKIVQYFLFVYFPTCTPIGCDADISPCFFIWNIWIFFFYRLHIFWMGYIMCFATLELQKGNAIEALILKILPRREIFSRICGYFLKKYIFSVTGFLRLLSWVVTFVKVLKNILLQFIKKI